MSEVLIWKDRNGSIEHIREGWHLRQPSSSSGAERNARAEEACRAKGIQKINEWNSSPLPMTFAFHHVNLVGNEGVWSETHQNPITGERHHEAGGTGVAELYYTIESETRPLVEKRESHADWHPAK